MSYYEDMPFALLETDPFLRPIIHMSPFTGKMDGSIKKYHEDSSGLICDFSNIVVGKNLSGVITANGREAISAAMLSLGVTSDCLISILAPSNCGYVSGCVTTEISKFCKYIYGFSEKADAYFVIHEFGRRMSLPEIVINSSKPIIEDCAYALVHQSFGGEYGKVGDYIIYSLGNLYQLTRHLKDLNVRRLEIYRRMQDAALFYGFEEAFVYDGKGLPHAFLVKLVEGIDVEQVKTYMNQKGVESSIFYGGGAYFLPCHYNLNDWEINYIFYHLNYSFQNSKVKN